MLYILLITLLLCDSAYPAYYGKDVEVYEDENGMTHFIGHRTPEEIESEERAKKEKKAKNQLESQKQEQKEAIKWAEKEADLVELRMMYESASPIFRPRVRRAIELRELSPSKLAYQYSLGRYDKGIIDQFINFFSAEQVIAVSEEIKKQRNF